MLGWPTWRKTLATKTHDKRQTVSGSLHASCLHGRHLTFTMYILPQPLRTSHALTLIYTYCDTRDENHFTLHPAPNLYQEMCPKYFFQTNQGVICTFCVLLDTMSKMTIWWSISTQPGHSSTNDDWRWQNIFCMFRIRCTPTAMAKEPPPPLETRALKDCKLQFCSYMQLHSPLSAVTLSATSSAFDIHSLVAIFTPSLSYFSAPPSVRPFPGRLSKFRDKHDTRARRSGLQQLKAVGRSRCPPTQQATSLCFP